MPFSTAHPAIILPLCKLSKKWVSATALIIGSLSPDFEYFYHLLPNRTYGHDFLHAAWFDLLITISVAFVFHLIVRNPLIDHLPPFLSQRFQSFKNFNWTNYFLKHFPIVVISAWIGIYSHLIWDELTHHNTKLVESSVFLSQYLTTILGRDVFVHSLLQHVSNIVGSVVVFATLLSFKRERSSFQNPHWMHFWFYSCLFAIGLLSFKFWLIADIFKPNFHYTIMLALTSVSSFFLGVVVTSFCYSVFKKTTKLK